MKAKFAEVILPLPLYDRFTYRIPESLEGKVKQGVRVIVQFGQRKNYSALVLALSDTAPGGFEIKSIQSVLDDSPVIHPVNLELWNWISDYYMGPLGEVMKAALPSALKLESNSVLSVLPGFPQQSFTAEEENLVNLLSDKDLPLKDIEKILAGEFSLRTIRDLIARHVVILRETIEEKYREKTKITIGISDGLHEQGKWEEALTTLNRSPKQKSLLVHFAQLTGLFSEKGTITVDRKKLMKGTGISEAVLRQLIEKGYFVMHQEVVSRLDSLSAQQAEMNLLNNWQQEAIGHIREQFPKKQVVLIHGVTASGKTEVYIHLIDETIRKGKQVLYLVPEISLTPQIVVRLKKVFGNKVGVYHSKMSDAERVEIWNKVLQSAGSSQEGFQIILGARSAIFLPFSDLGLVIVDEEHENSYKQYDPAPRYNARDMAVILGRQHKAPVLLGSATPSFESYLNALTGRYGLVKLEKRHGEARMPKVVVADLQRAFKRRQMVSMLSPDLFENMVQALETGNQVILFQNRRGYSPFVECMECGWIPWCINCDVSLTYHKKYGKLSCHYCGHQIKLPELCPKCQSAQIKTRGMGTEKIEDEITKLFPTARIARMDLDTTHSKNAFERIIHLLETRKIDILVGTQMVTKGLDIEHVGLVGVLNADNLLNFPDFRAHERAFQLIQQVSGRSGRKEKEGTVVIQTSQPQHQVIEFLKNNDYEGFFHHHIAERKAFFYPPWFKMIKIIAKHKNPAVLDSASMFLARSLRNLEQFMVMGPEYPLIGRVQQLYTKEIWLKIARNKSTGIKPAIVEAIEATKSLPGNSSLIIQIDVDPM